MSLQQWIDYSCFNHVCMTLAWEIYQLSRRTPQQTSRLPKTSAEDSRSWNRPMIQCQLWSPDITGSHWLFPGIDGNNQSGDWIISTVGFFSRFLGTSSNICHEVVGSSMFLPCGTNTAYYHLLSHQNQKKNGHHQWPLGGYNGFLPLNTRNPYVARVASGTNLRTNDKSHITDQQLWGQYETPPRVTIVDVGDLRNEVFFMVPLWKTIDG